MGRSRMNRKGVPPKRKFGAFWRQRELRVESLEVRALLSASAVLDSILAQPTFNSLGITNPTPHGYTPAQIRQA